jgi:DtxR family transcriptional regulator, Mn-dependent transcriptional regulator
LPSLTIENYVKTIYQTCAAQGERAAATGQIANALGVSPGTVTSMLKTLSDSGLAAYTPYEGVQLTESGLHLALRIVRRHRLVEQFLVQTLGFTWDEVHDEAEDMEHAVSDLLVDRIDAFLGFPTADPHGDPIPTADGRVAATDASSLAHWEVGCPFRLVRVLDQSPEFLRYLSERQLALGAVGTLVGCEPAADVLTINVDGLDSTLSVTAAGKLLVSPPRTGG